METQNRTINVSEVHGKLLRDPEFAALYLNDAIEEESTMDIIIALRCIAEAQQGGFDALARRMRMTPEAVDGMLSIKGDPGLAGFTKVTRALGLKLKTATRTRAHIEAGKQRRV